jgi:hypothetical protein
MKIKVIGIITALIAGTVAPVAFAQLSEGARTVFLKQQIEREIKPSLQLQGLSPAAINNVSSFLLGRAESAADAVDLGQGQKLSQDGISGLIANARAAIDSNIDTSFDKPTASLVREIIRNYVGYSQISSIYAPHMETAGVPLTGPQIRALANTLYDCNSTNVTADSPKLRMTVNAESGLSALDTLILSKASSYLGAGQLVVLRSDLRAVTATITAAN